MLHGLLFIALLFLIIMAIVVMLAVRFFWSAIVRMRDMLRRIMGVGPDSYGSEDYTGRRSSQYTFSHGGRRASSSSGRTSSSSDKSSSGGRRSQTSSGTTIIDNRNPEQARRKIFSEDEGEYVDFEES
ncbi:MAG: DUF4834 family protein [Prevotella sp.]|nr:DUF4834 family protein [Prevotella sp.]